MFARHLRRTAKNCQALKVQNRGFALELMQKDQPKNAIDPALKEKYGTFKVSSGSCRGENLACRQKISRSLPEMS